MLKVITQSEVSHFHSFLYRLYYVRKEQDTQNSITLDINANGVKFNRESCVRNKRMILTCWMKNTDSYWLSMLDFDKFLQQKVASPHKQFGISRMSTSRLNSIKQPGETHLKAPAVISLYRDQSTVYHLRAVCPCTKARLHVDISERAYAFVVCAWACIYRQNPICPQHVNYAESYAQTWERTERTQEPDLIPTLSVSR